jgi:hypothetical protein
MKFFNFCMQNFHSDGESMRLKIPAMDSYNFVHLLKPPHCYTRERKREYVCVVRCPVADGGGVGIFPLALTLFLFLLRFVIVEKEDTRVRENTCALPFSPRKSEHFYRANQNRFFDSLSRIPLLASVYYHDIYEFVFTMKRKWSKTKSL